MRLVALLALATWLAAPAHAQEGVGPGPWSDPDDPTVWPNETSHANGDRWLVEHHDEIRVMRPRLLVVNFSNELPPGEMERITEDLVAAIADSSRYHGYRDPAAPAFLQYEVFRYVDLRDEDGTEGNGARTPVHEDAGTDEINFDYGALFGEELARAFGVMDRRLERALTLAEMLDRGYVHEVWFLICEDPDVRAFEAIELKPVYDERFERPDPAAYVQAGNGGDPRQPWTGRSCRLNGINHDRGIGCAMENLGHALECMAHSRCIPYFTRWFHEYAGFELDRRYGVPFDSLYAVEYEEHRIDYPDPSTAVVRHGEETFRLTPYVVHGGNVHFLPNGRGHYDMENDQPVLSTIEDWRIGSGEGGSDVAKPWTRAVLEPFEALAPDCMGPWLVYWRQNMPGLDNRQKDEAGAPMKNWWPFLFY